jgi:hypothetical protein
MGERQGLMGHPLCKPCCYAKLSACPAGPQGLCVFHRLIRLHP